jgi:hypothetical protein
LQLAQSSSNELLQAQFGSAELQHAYIEATLSLLSESIETLDFSESPEYITVE